MQELTVKQNENNVPVVMNMQGTIDYESFITTLDDNQKRNFLAMAENITLEDKTSLQVYGSEINGTISQSSENLLSTVRGTNTDEIIGYVNDTLAQLKMIDMDDLDPNNKFKNFLRNVPILKNIVKSVENIMVKYDSIQENVDKISQKISVAKLNAKKDNSTLESMLKNNDISIERLKQLIVALKLKKQEFEEQVNTMRSSAQHMNSWELQRVNDFVNAIGKKIADLQMTERILSNNQYQIMAAQSNNDAIIDKCENIITHVIPIWENELSLAIVINRQQASIDATRKISEATNKMMQATAKKIRTSSEEAAKASEESVIKLETLKEANKELIDMLREVTKIHSDGVKQREVLEKTLVEMNKQVNNEIKLIETK